MIGKRFGRWVVVDKVTPYISPNSGASHPRWRCLCTCGNSKDVRESSLLQGDSQSCGCLAKEMRSAQLTTHGNSKHPLFSRHFDMLRRCYDSSRKDFKHYGGRGITVTDRWKDKDDGFKNFVEDMYSSFVEGTEIDRADVNGNYCKENCRWVSHRLQVINRRPTGWQFDTHFVEFNGKNLCLSQWQDVTGIPRSVLSDRLGKLNWSVERTLTVPVKIKRIYLVVNGVETLLNDVFKNVPMMYPRAKKFGLLVHEYLACLFSEMYPVHIEVAKQNLKVVPKQDLKQHIPLNNLQEDFKANVEEFFNEHGVQL